MKRIIFIFLFLFNISFIVSADDGPALINLQHKGHDNHWEHPAPAVQPEVSNFTAKDDDAFDDIVNFFRK